MTIQFYSGDDFITIDSDGDISVERAVGEELAMDTYKDAGLDIYIAAKEELGYKDYDFDGEAFTQLDTDTFKDYCMDNFKIFAIWVSWKNILRLLVDCQKKYTKG